MAKEQAGGTWLGVPEIIDAVTRLVSWLWDKSPVLGTIAVLLVLAFPFYCVHTWGTVKKRENAQLERVSNAKKGRKARGQKALGGKSK
jgi:hypothetical protein